MRSLLVAVAVCLLAVPHAAAGIYHPAEPRIQFPPNYLAMKLAIDDLRAIAAVPPEGQKPHPMRTHYLERAAELEGRRRLGLLSVEDRVNLSAYYLRLNEAGKAERVLQEIPPAKRNWMVLANLATATHRLAGTDATLLRRVVGHQKEALAAWPRMWPGLIQEELRWYRFAENYYLALLESRLAEAQTPNSKSAENVDDIFKGLEFVGPDGKYAVGDLAVEQWDKLPDRPFSIVGQLLVWLPDDPRVYWLMAELFNANGQIEGAAKMMDELVNNKFAPKLLMEHRRPLHDALPVAEALKEYGFPLAERLLWMTFPRGAGMADGAHTLVTETLRSWPPSPEVVDPPPPQTSPNPWNLDWKAVLVGLATGVIVGVLIALQMRALRSRQSVASHSKPVAPSES